MSTICESKRETGNIKPIVQSSEEIVNMDQESK